MKYLHIFTCIFGLSLECLALQKIQLPQNTIALMAKQIDKSYISDANSTGIIGEHIEFLKQKNKELAESEVTKENGNSHSYVSMEKCIACVVSLFDSGLLTHDRLKNLVKGGDKGQCTSAGIEERLTDDVVAEAIKKNNDGEKYKKDAGYNEDFLGSFQTHCLCLALRNGFLEKDEIERFVKERIDAIGKKAGFTFSDRISGKVAGACADAIQYFCLDKLIMDLTNHIYCNKLVVKKFETTNGREKEATAMNLLLSNNILRQKILDKKYKKTKENKGIKIHEDQNAIVSCGCRAILQSLPYSPKAWETEAKISLPASKTFSNSEKSIENILKGILGDEAAIKEQDFAGSSSLFPTPFDGGATKDWDKVKKDTIIYLCKNANSETSGERKQGVIGAFSPIKLKGIDENTTGLVKYNPLSFIGFSNDYKKVDLFERCGNSISYEGKDEDGYQSTKKAYMWRKNNEIVKDNYKLQNHPENYLFILRKEKI